MVEGFVLTPTVLIALMTAIVTVLGILVQFIRIGQWQGRVDYMLHELEKFRGMFIQDAVTRQFLSGHLASGSAMIPTASFKSSQAESKDDESTLYPTWKRMAARMTESCSIDTVISRVLDAVPADDLNRRAIYHGIPLGQYLVMVAATINDLYEERIADAGRGEA